MKAEAVRSKNERNWPMAFWPAEVLLIGAVDVGGRSQVFVTGSWRRSLGVDRMPITRMDAIDLRHDDWRMERCCSLSQVDSARRNVSSESTANQWTLVDARGHRL